MEDRFWLALATLGYLISSGWGAYALGARTRISNRWNDSLLLLSFLAHCAFLQQRGQAIGHCPLTNLFETVAFLSWSLVLTYLVTGTAYRMSILGAFTAPVVFFMNFFALITPIDKPNRMPPMGWELELHASMSVLAYGALGIAALASLIYLIEERALKRHDWGDWFYRLPPIGELEVVQQRLILWGFILLTIELWAGFYSPHNKPLDWVKMIWSGAVWLLYLVLLLTPRLTHLSHKKIAWCSLGGYAFVLLTFWGINSISQSHRFDL
jgi:ABC-type uncharacterized transport system permease subunit